MITSIYGDEEIIKTLYRMVPIAGREIPYLNFLYTLILCIIPLFYRFCNTLHALRSGNSKRFQPICHHDFDCSA